MNMISVGGPRASLLPSVLSEGLKGSSCEGSSAPSASGKAVAVNV